MTYWDQIGTRLTWQFAAAWIGCALLVSGPLHAGAARVRAGKLIDVERGRVLSDQAIQIDGERIVAIGDFKTDRSAGGRLIDWSATPCCPA